MTTLRVHPALLVFAAVFALLPRSADASGFGISTGLATGIVRVENSSPTGGGTAMNRYTQHKALAGLFFDSNLFADRLFNYRFSMAYENASTHQPDRRHYEGIGVENDFGFGFSTGRSRLWVGPELRINYNSDYVLGLGVGPAVGINVLLGDDVALCAKASYIYSRQEAFFDEDKEQAGYFTIGLAWLLGRENPRPASSP